MRTHIRFVFCHGLYSGDVFFSSHAVVVFILFATAILCDWLCCAVQRCMM